ncbi:ribosome maturation factor RimP [Bacteroidota bacterium]
MSEGIDKADARLERINQLVDSVLVGTDLYRVETMIKGSANHPIVDIFVDGDEGVNIGQCARVNRAVYASIELEAVFGNGFKLNVSSPGLGRPLRLARQYRRHIGRNLEMVVRAHESEDRISVEGKLVNAAEAGITIADGDATVEYRFEEIERAVVAPSF